MQSSTEERSEFSVGARGGTGLQRAPSSPVRSKVQAPNSEQNVGDLERVLSSVVGGALLLSALRAPTPASAARLLGGSALLHRGLTGHCYLYSAIGRDTSAPTGERAAVKQSITIGKSPEELYRFWQDPNNVSTMMKDFAQVEDQGDGRWRWTVTVPGNRKLTWTTRSTAQQPGELIGWRSEPDAPFVHEGSVRFRKAPRDLGSEVTLSMSFGAEHGPLRKLTSQMFKKIPRALEETILRHCKSLCEAGEIPSLARNPDARTAEPQRLTSPAGATRKNRSLS